MPNAKDTPILIPEVLPPAYQDRSQNNTFAVGNPGRPTGSINKVANSMKQALAAEIAKGGDDANPLLILLRVARDPAVLPQIKISAADRLLRYLMPQLSTVELQNLDPEFESATLAIKSRLRNLFVEGANDSSKPEA